MFESRRAPLLPVEVFVRRVAAHAAVALAILGFALGSGVLGYRYFEQMAWIDALLNASMILGGMGPVNELHTHGGKVFASCYALFSGTIFLVFAAVLLAPAIHRYAHKFHLEPPDGQDAGQATS